MKESCSSTLHRFGEFALNNRQSYATGTMSVCPSAYMYTEIVDSQVECLLRRCTGYAELVGIIEQIVATLLK